MFDKIWYKISRIFGILKTMPPINQTKINSFLSKWNEGRNVDDPLWIEITGTNALVQMDINHSTSITFHANRGFPLKGFINTETQEIRIFDARRFT